MQNFIRKTVLVVRFFCCFTFFERRSYVTPSEAWHDNSENDIPQKSSVLKVLILIVCWPETFRCTTTGSLVKQRLTYERRNFISREDDS